MTTKRMLWILAIVFALYAVYHDPTGSGDAVQGVFGVIDGLLQSTFTFFNAIID